MTSSAHSGSLLADQAGSLRLHPGAVPSLAARTLVIRGPSSGSRLQELHWSQQPVATPRDRFDMGAPVSWADASVRGNQRTR